MKSLREREREVALTVKVSPLFLINLLKRLIYINIFQHKFHIKIIALSLLNLNLSVTDNIVSNYRLDSQHITVFKSRLLQSSL